MDTTIQIRHVPRDVHRRLKARAAREGLSLSQFMLREASRIAGEPTFEEFRERLRKLPTLRAPEPVEVMVRKDRDAR